MAQSDLKVVVSLRDKASKKLSVLNKKFENVAQKASEIGKKMAVAGAAITGFFGLTVKAASDLNESINAVNVIFKEGADIILDFGKKSAESVGLATAEFNQMASVTGALLKDTGLPLKEVAKITTDLSVRAADMASVMNTNVRDAIDAINQAIRGETEAIRRYTGDVTDATLQQFLMSQGIKKSVKDLTEQEKRLYRVKLILSQTNKFAGDFARTNKELANKMRVLKAQIVNLAVVVGNVLRPIITKILNEVTPLIERLKEWIDKHPVLFGWIVKISAAIGALLLVLAPLFMMLPGMVIAFKGLKLALASLTSTTGLVIIAIGALIAVGFLVYKNWDKIKEFLLNIWNIIANFVIDKFNKIKNFIININNAIKGFFVKIYTSIYNFFVSILEKMRLFVVSFGEGLKAGFSAIWTGVKNVTLFIIGLIIGSVLEIFSKFGIDLKQVLKDIYNSFVTAFNTIWSFLQIIFDNIKQVVLDLYNFFGETFEQIKNAFVLVFSFIGNFLGNIFNKIKDVIVSVWTKTSQKTITIWTRMKVFIKESLSYIKDIINVFKDPIVNAFKSMWESVKNTVIIVFEGIKGIIKGSINWMIDKINYFIERANAIARKGNVIPGVEMPQIPLIPRLAKGGIVTKPTIAMIGEAGPEAVVPLKKNFAGVNVNITINGDVTGEEVVEKVKNSIIQELKLYNAVV